MSAEWFSWFLGLGRGGVGVRRVGEGNDVSFWGFFFGGGGFLLYFFFIFFFSFFLCFFIFFLFFHFFFVFVGEKGEARSLWEECFVF